MSQYSKNNPCCLRIKNRHPLSKTGSTKETFHVALDTVDSDISFKVGDAVAIFPKNPPQEVQAIIDLLHADSEDKILHPKTGTVYSFYQFLEQHVNLQKTRPSLLHHALECQEIPFLRELLEKKNKEKLSNLLGRWNLIDWLKAISLPFTPEELSKHLMPMMPRFYSIASSPKVHSDEIHLTVACFSYFHEGAQKRGIGSDFLCYRAEIGKTPIPCYIQSTSHFTLPSDASRDIIMIGPGTGVAPYKAFLEERIHLGAPGKNWLFFGERNKKYDFFYEEFFQNCVQKGKLQLDLAFSRDQENKIYVQHRMLEKGAELCRWLENGAYVYICGDARHMAKDVNAALLEIISLHKNLSEENAKDYIKNLRKEKRLLMDVY
ncbi:MAG: hypothetical protein Tsb0015_16460 [Simkaniaceae bacterium]